MKVMLLMCLETKTTKLTSPEEKKEEKTTLGLCIYLIRNPMLSCSYVLPFEYCWLLNKETNKQTNKQTIRGGETPPDGENEKKVKKKHTNFLRLLRT